MARSIARTSIRVTAAAVVVSAAALVLTTVVGDAQQPKAQPKAAPKQPAPAPPAQAPASDPQLQVVYSPWAKVCGKDPDPAAKELCLTISEARLETGSFLAGVALIEDQGEQKKILRVTFPLGMQLPHGARVIVDQGQPNTGRFIFCLANGCQAEFEATPAFIGQLKGGKTLWLQAFNMSGQPAQYSLPLAEFAKAHDGPAVDPQAFEERQQKLQSEMERRAEEIRKKLESQAGKR
jgi:invasion protein IalB